MKKAKKQAAKPAKSAGNTKQGSILTFFQNATHTKQVSNNSLFSVVGDRGTDRSGVLHVRTNDSIDATTDSNDSIDDDCMIVPGTPESDFKNSMSFVVVERTDVTKQPMKCGVSSMTGLQPHVVTKSGDGSRSVDVDGTIGGQVSTELTLGTSESALISDTPDKRSHPHRKFNRSFLCAAASLKPMPPVQSSNRALGNKRAAPKTTRRKLHSILPVVVDNTVKEVASLHQLQQMGIVCPPAVVCGKSKQAPTGGLSPQRKRRELSPQRDVADEQADLEDCGELITDTEQIQTYRPFQWRRGITANKAAGEINAEKTQTDDVLSSILDELKTNTEFEGAPSEIAKHELVDSNDFSKEIPVVGEKNVQNVGVISMDAELSDIMSDLVSQYKTEDPAKSNDDADITNSTAGSTALADIIHELRNAPVNTFRTPSKMKLKKRKTPNHRASADKLKPAIDLREDSAKNQAIEKSVMDNFRNDKFNEFDDITDEMLLSCWSPCKVRPKDVDSSPKSCRKSLALVETTEEESGNDVEDAFSTVNLDEDDEVLRTAMMQHDEKEKTPSDTFGRHVVTAMHETRDYVQLDVTAANDNTQRKVYLHGFWMDSEVTVGDVINVLGRRRTEWDTEEDSCSCSVTDDECLLVVNPDFLISGTTVVSSLFCMRKSILSDKFRIQIKFGRLYQSYALDSGLDRNVHMLLGSIIHALFQQVLKVRGFSESRIRQLATEILSQKKFLHEMYNHSINEEAVLDEIQVYIPTIMSSIEKYFKIGSKTMKNHGNLSSDEQITSIVDIEENIWSPRFGLKGNIDVTVEAVMKTEPKKRILPLELKTGKASYSVEHKGQVTLYSMMTSDRREDPRAGLLMYLKAATMQMVSADHANQRGLIQIRNSLSHYMQPRIEQDEASGHMSIGALPPPIDKERFCAKCPQLLNCALLQRSEGFDAAADHAMSSLVPQAVQHLSDRHLAYFYHWCLLIHLEGTVDSNKSALKDIWCKCGQAREESGQCWSGMVLVPTECRQFGEENYLQTFVRHSSHRSAVPLPDVGIIMGDSVIVSEERHNLIALSTGFVQEVTTEYVTLTLDRNLCSYPDHKAMVFRLDKGSSFNSMSMGLTSLSRLMADDQISARLRELIIDKRRPQFELSLSKRVVENVKHVFNRLNKPQKRAILKVLMSKDYVLIKGYPGTGKTSIIVSLVRILVSLGQSIILTSYTNAAVDNILLKLKQYNIDMTRLGRLAKIHPDIVVYSAEKQTSQLKTVEDLTNFYNSKSVIASTCLASGGEGVFRQRVFDVCIVDEASQVSQLACVTPLFSCGKFVLVGDPRQLPPLVCSVQARNLGMDESLFAKLDDAGGTYELNLQYRMNSCIMRLCNELVYDGALKCGSQDVATGTLQLAPLTEDLPSWLSFALSSKTGCEVVFLNMDDVSADKENSSVQNRAEAAVIFCMIKTALEAGIVSSDVGVIAPYQQQVRLLRDGVQQYSTEASNHCHHRGPVEVNTVDQYQGRDKSAIFISFVKNKTGLGATGGILADKRRLNVALSRARHKLVMVGSKTALSAFPAIGELLTDILQPEQMVSLPCDVLNQCTDLLNTS